MRAKHKKTSTKTSSNTSKVHKTKSVKIKHHHKKAYRKRHYGALTIFLLVGLILSAFILQYKATLDSNVRSAKSYIEDVFGNGQNSESQSTQRIKSTYGYELTFNRGQFYATGLDTSTGEVYIGSELTTNRAYSNVRISPVWSRDGDSTVSMTVEYRDDVIIQNPTEPKLFEVEKVLIEDANDSKTTSLTKLSTEETKVGGVKFVRSEWERQPKEGLSNSFKSRFATFIGVVNGKPLVITVNRGLQDSNDSFPLFRDVLNSIQFGERTQAVLGVSSELAQSVSGAGAIANRLLLSGVASAESAEASSSEKNSAIYGPAVVKIYSAYCMDISAEGRPYIVDACSAQTGSGFFINKDGYIATNGHVLPMTAKDTVIKHALVSLVAGETVYFDYLAQLSGLTLAELTSEPDQNARFQIAVDKFYGIDDSIFQATNRVENLLVDLNEKQPDAKELVELTTQRKEYPEQDTIKRAKVVAMDYRTIDGITAFRASDVGIIKIDGDKFPQMKLGIVDSVGQGSNLSILGFPGQAGKNGIIDDTQSKVTLTSGKVSSVKNALGSDKKLIETDTTIGHGNSGGPVLNDSGEVVGLATYTADGSGQGNGVFNYIRDVKDLIDLAGTKSVDTVGKASATQLEWEKGLDYFYNARYSKSLKNFSKVKEAYPHHSKVTEFIATAEQRIKNGEDVKDFPILIVSIAGVVVLLGVGAAAFMIIRHRKAHNVYKAHVAGGNMQPIAAGMPAQQVSYNPAEVKAVNNPIPGALASMSSQNPVITPQQPNAVAPGNSDSPQQQLPPDGVQPQVSVPVQQDVQPVATPQSPQVITPDSAQIITPQQPNDQ